MEELILAPAKAVRGDELATLKERIRRMEEQMESVRRRVEIIEKEDITVLLLSDSSRVL